MTALQEKIAAATCERAGEFLHTLGTEIEIQVAECADYSALLRGDHQKPVLPDHVLEWARQAGRVIVSARGASGKSALLRRLALAACKQGGVPFLLDLSRWNQAATEEWAIASTTPRDALSFLLMKFGLSGHDMADVEFLPPTVAKYFLLDGLNETPGSTADQILAACDAIASILVGTSVVATDRLIRRNLDGEERWRFAMPLPVSKSEVAKHVDPAKVALSAQSLLSSPFFLDRAMHGELKQSPLATIRDLLDKHGKLSPSELTIAVTAAYHAYSVDQSRTFDRVHFDKIGGGKIVENWLAGGILVKADDRIAFAHHWYHDYLASRYVVEKPELWEPESRHQTFDALTFGANSFDAIAFALEQAKAPQSGLFLQAVYDWNPYAAGYALAEANIGSEDVPGDVRQIILGMLAERRFDRQFFSARRSDDALDLLHDSMAAELRAADSSQSLQQLIEKKEFDSLQYKKWQALFILKEGSQAPDSVLKSLEDEDSVIGWTAANVLKRLKLSSAQMEVVATASRHTRPVVRWRAVHVMGGFAHDLFVAALLDRLDHDSDENVRYGAIRSLVELASRDGSRLQGIVTQIIEHLGAITRSSKVLTEFTRSIFLAKQLAPPNWVEEISRVLYHLMESATVSADVDHWSGLASRLRIHHRTVEFAKVAA